MPSEKKFYLTTPIYYVNARPHIGHAYSTIVADVIARRHRLLGDDTWFLTGTDEHGQKIERSAAAAGIPPQEFADQVSKTFSDLWKRMGITNDDFIRTTEPRHKQGVQKLFADLQANDAIYTDTYTGQYCVSDEAYVEVGPGEPCPDCGNITETISESNYYFKLSAYGDRIAARIESNELLIQPDSRRNEILSFVRGGLKDLSISRTSFKWGIPVPGDESHVIYVWLDALANYMTAVGYGSDKPEDIAKFERYWPANLHLVGKEIIRFHCVYWPAFLMALRPADSPLSEAEWNDKWVPKSIVANGWLLFEESKMSKSRGNVVRTETILDAFGTLCPPTPVTTPPLSSFDEVGGSAVPPEAPQPLAPSKQQQDLFATDVLRYFLLREIPFGQDGSFSFDALVQRYNSDLANGYGNLVSRTLNMIASYYGGIVPVSSESEEIDYAAFADWAPSNPEVEDERQRREDDELYQRHVSELPELEDWQFLTTRLKKIAHEVSAVDRYLSEQKPWKLAKLDDNESKIKLANTLYRAAEEIRIITILLYPYLPYATAQVWSQLGLDDIEELIKDSELKDLKWGGLKPGTKLGPLAPIFPRAPKELIQAMIATEENNAQAAAAAKTQTSLIDEAAPTAEENHPSTHPAAGPRTAIFSSDNPAAQVAGSAALTTERPGTPSHTEAPASAPFANAAAASEIPGTPQIAIDDFVKIDLRVAKIIVAERIPKADKLLRLEVDLGYEKRQILSGIAEWYAPEDLIGRAIVVIANLAPRKMRGLESHGMLLAASHGENGKPILATFGEDIALGSRLR
jgi:methionyl-tRNA synthetase